MALGFRPLASAPLASLPVTSAPPTVNIAAIVAVANVVIQPGAPTA